MKNLIIMLISLTFISCSGDEEKEYETCDAVCQLAQGTPQYEPRPKDLFNIWEEEQTSFYLDLKEAEFDLPMTFAYWFDDGSVCLCEFTISGNQTSGNWDMNYCYYEQWDAENYNDPGCNSLNDIGVYSKNNDTLIITSTDGVEVYH